MARASWNGVVIAESEETVLVEGNHYFPPAAIKTEHFEVAQLNTVCPWKGTASYYDVVVNGERIQNAAWYYPEPKSDAEHIRDHVAFQGGVVVER